MFVRISGRLQTEMEAYQVRDSLVRISSTKQLRHQIDVNSLSDQTSAEQTQTDMTIH